MATSVTSRFVSYLRGLFSRAAKRVLVGTTPPPPSGPQPSLASTRAPAVLPPKKKKDNKQESKPASSSPAQAAPAAATVAAPSAAAAAAAVASGALKGEEIEVPLASVIAGLPLELRAKLMSPLPANKSILLQAEVVVSQLAFGAVKISFGELRQLAPGVFVNSGAELDNKLVSLPLQEILSRVNPALLARRSSKKVEVNEEIAGPFSDRGRGFTFTTQPLKTAPPPPPAQPVPSPSAPSAPIAFNSPPPPARNVAPAPKAPAPPAAPVNGSNGHNHPPASPLSPPRSGGGAAGNALPPGVRLGMSGGNRAEAPAPAPASAPIRMAGAPATSAPSASKPASGPAIFAALRDLCETWPDVVKSEVMDGPLAQVSVPLDGATILPGLKRGRVVMTWKQIRQLAQPGSGPSANDNLELELPLKVIAPMFMAAQKGSAKAQTKASVSAEIPDLFFGFPQPSAATAPVAEPAPAAPAAPVVPPLSRPEPKLELKPEARPVDDTNFYSWTDKNEGSADESEGRRETEFLNRQTHPKDVVSKAAVLPGVAGAVVGMQDGLRVASQVPSDLNPDTLAAFLPQIFERVNQTTRELRMGALNNISFTVGNVPWKIFRVNSVYFAIFGRPAEPLPSAQLAQLAAQLDRKKPQ